MLSNLLTSFICIALQAVSDQPLCVSMAVKSMRSYPSAVLNHPYVCCNADLQAAPDQPLVHV
jgi:hypothetical protein